MTITNGYCSADELRIELKKQGDATAKTLSILEQAINNASRFIDAVTERVFYAVPLTNEKVDIYGMSDNELSLDSIRQDKIVFPAPIISISALTESGETLTENTDFFVYKKQGYITKATGSRWTTDQQGIVLSGSMGYATTPGHINRYCLAIASAITGLSAQILNDEDGNAIGVIRNYVPKWCLDALKKEKRRVVV